MNSRLVPYDLDFKKLNVSRNVEKWFLISTFVLSLVVNLTNEITFSLNELILNSLFILSILSTTVFTILSIINDYILFPSCENKRRTKFIDSSFHSNLSLTDIDPNFYSTAHKISREIMSSIRDQMLIQERYLLQIISKKLNTPIENLFISRDTHFKVYQLISKLLQYTPGELIQMLEHYKVDRSFHL